jgi:hypothetical protein
MRTYPNPATDETISILHHACFVISDALIMEGVELTKTLIEQDIPGYVFELAIRLGVWPEPEELAPGVQTAHLGLYDVFEDERAYFVSLIEDELSHLHGELEGRPKRTPAEIYLERKEELDMTWADFADWLGVSEAQLRQRLMNPDYAGTKRSTLEPAAKRLRCHWTELRWPKKQPE